MAVGGIAGAFLGVEIAVRAPVGILRRIFACYIIVVGIRMLFAPGARTNKEGADIELKNHLLSQADEKLTEGKQP